VAKPSRSQTIWIVVGSLLQASLLAGLWFAFVYQGFGDDVLVIGGGGGAPPEAYSVYTGEGITRQQFEQRPLAVMIAGDPITRPQSGLGIADVVVEMEAAQGITRFMALFQSVIPEQIGSIRSARNDYIDLARGFDAVFVHWGGEKLALDRLASDNTEEIDQFQNGDLFYRDPAIPAPHNGFTTEDGMQEGLERYDYERTPKFSDWEFTDASDLADRPTAGLLELIYGSQEFNIEYAYDPDTNTYARSQGGLAHEDAVSGSQIATTNIIVMRAGHRTYSQAGGYLEVAIQNGGECSLYRDGREIPCKWDKGSQDDPLIFETLQGSPLSLTPGKTWVQVMLPGADVDWSASYAVDFTGQSKVR